jgi:hypothetical protein
MHRWCAGISEQTSRVWQDTLVHQIDFKARRPKTLQQAVSNVCSDTLMF